MSESNDINNNWIPLESNPELMNSYLWKLGVPMNFAFHEVYGTDPDLLGMVPQPCHAVLLLFPHSDNHNAYVSEENLRIEEQGQEVSEQVYFMGQKVGNACGTIGMIHAVLNNAKQGVIPLEKGKFFANYLEDTKELSADERAVELGTNSEIRSEHAELAVEATSNADHSVNANLHFIAFVHCDGNLYELDGCKPAPVNHGACKPETLLEDSVAVIKQFMARDPDDIRFNMLSLGENMDM